MRKTRRFTWRTRRLRKRRNTSTVNRSRNTMNARRPRLVKVEIMLHRKRCPVGDDRRLPPAPIGGSRLVVGAQPHLIPPVNLRPRLLGRPAIRRAAKQAGARLLGSQTPTLQVAAHG